MLASGISRLSHQSHLQTRAHTRNMSAARPIRKRTASTADIDDAMIAVTSAASVSASGSTLAGASTLLSRGASEGALTAPKPSFPALSGASLALADESRAVRVPTHRYTPLKEAWDSIIGPIVEHMKLMIRMNARTRSVEIKTSPYTTDSGALQRAEDFVRAFLLGFEVRDALALLRMEDLFVESFEVTDVKPLKGDHLSRAIGRIAGQVRI